MSQEPDYSELNPALWEATQQVLQHLGVAGSEYSELINATDLFLLAAEKQAGNPQGRPWDFAYGAACELLYRACQDSGSLVYGWLRSYFLVWFRGKLNGDSQTAEDLTGDVIEIIVKRLAQVRFPTAFMAWAEQIALRQFNDYLSKKDRFRTGPTPAASLNPTKGLEEIKPLLKFAGDQVENLAAGVNPEAVVLERELRDQLFKSIQAMRSNTKNSRYYRLIIIGFYFENKSIEELSDLLGLPVTKISKLKNQALLNLRKIWQDFENQNSH